MRKISANLILPVSSPPLKNGIIRLDDENRILEVIDTGGNLTEEPGLEFFSGVITPGFVLPVLRLDAPQDRNNSAIVEKPSTQVNDPANLVNLLSTLELDLVPRGIKGMGLILREALVSDDGLNRMADSPLTYHPVIELCPEPDEDTFEVFHRGIELISLAWNEFNITCSVSACSGIPGHSDLHKYIREYASSHRNFDPPPGLPEVIRFEEFSPDILPLLNPVPPGMNPEKYLSRYTLEAAAMIFEHDMLGSIEPGKEPGLNLISGLDPGTLSPLKKPSLRVLV